MKRILLIIGLCLSITLVNAQLATFKSAYDATSDTAKVTNGETAQLKVTAGGSANTTLIWIAVAKVSGTVAGTITMQGSIDGTTYKAMNTPSSQTALATITATDATNTYHYILPGNPFKYYRISWTGTGTMVATVSAKILQH